MTDDRPASSGVEVARLLSRALGDEHSELVEGAFVDSYQPVDDLGVLVDHFRGRAMTVADADQLSRSLRATRAPGAVERVTRCLGELPPEQLGVLADHPDPALREVHARALAHRDRRRREVERWHASLLAALAQPDARVRAAAVDSVGERFAAGGVVDPDPVRTALRGGLGDVEPAVRRAAARVLGRHLWSGGLAETFVDRLAVEPDEEVRVELVGGLTRELRRPPARALPVLANLTAVDERPRVRAAAVIGLRAFGAAGTEPLVAAPADPDEQVRRTAIRQLGVVAGADALPALALAYSHAQGGAVRELPAAIQAVATRPAASLPDPETTAAALRALIGGAGPGLLSIGVARAVRADGTVVRIDPGSGRTLPEVDDIADFAVRVRAAVRYPQLRGLVRGAAPWDARVCTTCRSSGEVAGRACAECDGLGWIRFDPAAGHRR